MTNTKRIMIGTATSTSKIDFPPFVILEIDAEQAREYQQRLADLANPNAYTKDFRVSGLLVFTAFQAFVVEHFNLIKDEPWITPYAAGKPVLVPEDIELDKSYIDMDFEVQQTLVVSSHGEFHFLLDNDNALVRTSPVSADFLDEVFGPLIPEYQIVDGSALVNRDGVIVGALEEPMFHREDLSGTLSGDGDDENLEPGSLVEVNVIICRPGGETSGRWESGNMAYLGSEVPDPEGWAIKMFADYYAERMIPYVHMGVISKRMYP